ncbi:hypothetical protein PpBr36_03994 [Pyricularia pennisetigena]|uniref:hypothetical protein n=1 Tax=Pyricularia pennisetigena TaxID=1578925 RepID=UPI0011533219|nr:hypothetical protein PpBr36_03994 [Pyricularia pennisetigena]TLS26225.1 hypothetical protein PpBr36_03994 [Pyricularia pennisetigena]
MYGSTIALGLALVSTIISGAAAAKVLDTVGLDKASEVPDTMYRGDHRNPVTIYKEGGFFPRGRAVGVEPDPDYPYDKHVASDFLDPKNLESPWQSVSVTARQARGHILYTSAWAGYNRESTVYVYHIDTRDEKLHYHDVNALYKERGTKNPFAYEGEFLSDQPILWKYITAWDEINLKAKSERRVQTTSERLTTNTVGLVALSDFRKRRAEVLEQQEREAREKSKASTPVDAGTPANASEASDGDLAQQQQQQQQQSKKSRKKQKRAKIGGLSFAADDEGDGEEEDGGDGAGAGIIKKKAPAAKSSTPQGGDATAKTTTVAKAKLAPNASVAVVPRAPIKPAERDALRAEFLALQAAVKATEIAIPFVFYDGTNLRGGTVTVKKGDFVWVFLDKSRKVGARHKSRRDWARVGVDDLMMVRGTVIIPHHYDFYFFAINKTVGPGGKLLFNYSAEAPKGEQQQQQAKGGELVRTQVNINTLEGHNDDPNLTKVVDRRWYEKNKHIYPATLWHEFDPDRDYRNEFRRDTDGNTFFYSK